MSVQEAQKLEEKAQRLSFQYIICVGSSSLMMIATHILEGFNTSYVSVQAGYPPKSTLINWCFNTSYVSVQAVQEQGVLKSMQFQYIICVGSRVIATHATSHPIWFQYIICVGSREERETEKFFILSVSIHHMCRFKAIDTLASRVTALFQYIICVGSRLIKARAKAKGQRFQYIICVGSSLSCIVSFIFIFWFQYIICVGSREKSGAISWDINVSIHHMCRFKL